MPLPESASGNWSDGETTTLIDAWGPIHQRRRPGRLLSGDWRTAARAVNTHRAAVGRRFNRTRIQCKTRIDTLKKRYKEEVPKQPPSGWRHLPRLRAFLASPDDSPPGFPARASPTVVKQEVVEEEEEEVVVGPGGGIGLAGSWTVPRRPRNAAAGTGFCPGEVVVKLAEVYERVELARIAAKKVKMEQQVQEMEQPMFDAMKMEQPMFDAVKMDTRS